MEKALECIHEWITVKSADGDGLTRMWDKEEDTKEVGTLYGVPIKSNPDVPDGELIVSGKLERPFKYCIKCQRLVYDL